MNRRQFLGVSGTALAVGSAGCSAFESEEREGVILTHVELGNASTDPQIFDIIVSYNDEFIHWDSHEVEARIDKQELGGEVIEIDAPDDPGSVDVYVRVGESREHTDFDTDRYDGKRVTAIATYGLPEDRIIRISRVISDRSPSPTG